MTSRTSWGSCSRRPRLRRFWTRGRRKRRKVKNKVLKVRSDFRGALGVEMWHLWLLIKLCVPPNRRPTHSKGSPPTRGRVHWCLPEVQILLQSAGVYFSHHVLFYFTHLILLQSEHFSEFISVFLSRLVWNQQSTTLHQRSLCIMCSNL